MIHPNTSSRNFPKILQISVVAGYRTGYNRCFLFHRATELMFFSRNLLSFLGRCQKAPLLYYLFLPYSAKLPKKAEVWKEGKNGRRESKKEGKEGTKKQRMKDKQKGKQTSNKQKGRARDEEREEERQESRTKYTKEGRTIARIERKPESNGSKVYSLKIFSVITHGPNKPTGLPRFHAFNILD